MAGRWSCLRGGQPVKVVQGDGQVLSILPPVKVADILVNHPHHYICQMCAELPTNKSPMLSLDHDLEPGYMYFLIPLPRLFPTSSAGPPSCCCQASNLDTSIEDGHTTPCRESKDVKFGISSALTIKGMQRMMERIGSPMRTAKKQVSPELSRPPTSAARDATSPLLSPTYGSTNSSKRSGGIATFSCSRGSKSQSQSTAKSSSNKPPKIPTSGKMPDSSRCFIEELCSLKWKPGLGCISETDALGPACQERRLCLDRRRLTFDSRLPRSSSPSRSLDVNRPISRERSAIFQSYDQCTSKPMKQQSLDDEHKRRPMDQTSLADLLFTQ